MLFGYVYECLRGVVGVVGLNASRRRHLEWRADRCGVRRGVASGVSLLSNVRKETAKLQTGLLRMSNMLYFHNDAS